MGEPASTAIVIIRMIDNGILGGESGLANPADAWSKPVGVGIEVSEFERAIGDGEDVVFSLREAYVVSGEVAREKERLASPLDVATSIDQPNEGAVGIDERWKPSWIGARGRRVEMSRRSVLWKTLVRSVVVILCSVGIEASLLRSERLGCWSGCRSFQSFVKSLVRSVLRGASWCNVFGPDAKPYPPESECAEPAQSIGLSEWDPVICSKNQGQPVVPEKSDKNLARGCHGSGLERLAAQEIMRVEIQHRERVAICSAPLSQSELPLEVSGPDHVGLQGSRARTEERSSLWTLVPAFRANEIHSLQQLAYRARRGPAYVWLVLMQPVTQHRGSIKRILTPESNYPLSHFRRNSVRLQKSRPRSVRETARTFFSKSLEPLLASLLTDPEPVTDLNYPLVAVQARFDKR